MHMGEHARRRSVKDYRSMEDIDQRWCAVKAVRWVHGVVERLCLATSDQVDDRQTLATMETIDHEQK